VRGELRSRGPSRRDDFEAKPCGYDDPRGFVGWHDGDGDPVHADAIPAAREFAAAVTVFAAAVTVFAPALRAYPTLEGGITLEHQAGHGGWSAEFCADGTVFVVVARFAGDPEAFPAADRAHAEASLQRFLTV
jgi:hypothetical protein